MCPVFVRLILPLLLLLLQVLLLRSCCSSFEMLKLCVLGALAAVAAGHSNLIYPKPRNAVDSFDPRWEHGKNSPDLWQANLGPVHGQACACRNGSSTCDICQTCLWMSAGCSHGHLEHG